jgi:alpha-L-fucosidase
MQIKEMPISEYEKLPPRFNPTGYNAAEWVSLFKRAGAKYVTITSKHHDGFAMWNSEVSDWDIVDSTPYGRDVLKPLAEECRKQGLKLFFYHSHLDWHHPDYFPRGRTGQHAGRPASGDFNKYLDTMDAQLTELLGGDYGEVAGIWFDGWWDQRAGKKGEGDPRTSRVDWRLEQSYALIHRLQPQALVGNNHHLAPFDGEDFQMFERDLPGENKGGFSEEAQVGALPLETCDTINGAWGYNAGDKNYKTAKQLVDYLVRAAGRNANFLLNIGPRPDGTIQPEFVERLEVMGKWLDQYGPTIYATHGGPVAPQTWGVATHTDEHIYLHVLDAKQAADGWLTLTGTADLKQEKLKRFDTNTAIESRRNAAGEFQIRLPDDAGELHDLVLVTE